MRFVYSDGGRSEYFKAENVGDCVCRAICNATGLDYKKVYDELNRRCKATRLPKRRRTKSSSAREGVYRKTYAKYIESFGWKWIPTMLVGHGCQTHLREDELPNGTLIVKVSRHLTCVKDGVLYDTYDCTRDGERCVYGYWKAN